MNIESDNSHKRKLDKSLSPNLLKKLKKKKVKKIKKDKNEKLENLPPNDLNVNVPDQKEKNIRKNKKANKEKSENLPPNGMNVNLPDLKKKKANKEKLENFAPDGVNANLPDLKKNIRKNEKAKHEKIEHFPPNAVNATLPDLKKKNKKANKEVFENLPPKGLNANLGNNMKRKKLRKNRKTKKMKLENTLPNEHEENLPRTGIDPEEFPIMEDDPIYHYKGSLNEEEVKQLCSIENWSRSRFQYEYMGRSFVETPEIEIIKRVFCLRTAIFQPYLFPTPSTGTFAGLTSPYDVSKYTKEHLVSRIPAVNNFTDTDEIGLTPLQNDLLSVIGRYSDLYYTEAKHDHLDEIRFAYCLHVLNHLSKCKSFIVYNNERLKVDHKKLYKNVDPFKDMGFTRPRVLILAPFKNTAYKIVQTLISILFKMAKGGEVHNLDRFKEDYGPKGDVKPDRLNRPADFHAIFEEDINENFKIGIKISKGSMKLYSKFYHSDIILASPLGLRMAIGSKKTKNFETDFINSIEIVLLDQADVMLMQNWDNALYVLDHLNLRQRELENIYSIMRVRRWNLSGFAKHYRQTIILSSFIDVYQRHVYMKSRNYAGRVEVINKITEGSINQITVRAELDLWLIEDGSPKERMKFFIKNMLPALRKQKQLLLYIPDYYDYVYIVWYLRTHGGIEFSTLNEYMINESPGQISEARSAFYEQRRNMIIMTERFQFYTRYCIKGIKNILFYSLPKFPNFVPEVCNWLAPKYQNKHIEGPKAAPLITVLFDESSISKMCYFVGTAKTQKLWRTKRKFCTMTIYGDKVKSNTST